VSENENFDVQRDILGERLEIVEITLQVLREQIESLDARIALLQRLNQ
jgi:prefoldin subunit 5